MIDACEFLSVIIHYSSFDRILSVVYENGEILAELPLPVFGIMSDLPIETIVQRMQEIKSVVSDLSVLFPNPLLILITLTGAAIPYLKSVKRDWSI